MSNNMLYFKFDVARGKKPKDTFWSKLSDWLLRHFIPMANPTLEKNIAYIRQWYIEYDDVEKYTNREVGVTENGLVVFKAPFDNNLGYWCDNNMTMDDYRSLGIHAISKEAFEKLWSKEVLLPSEAD